MMPRFDLLVVGDANPDVVIHGAPRELFRLPVRELAGRAVEHDVGVGVADHQQIEAGGHARRRVSAARATLHRRGDFIAATRG